MAALVKWDKNGNPVTTGGSGDKKKPKVKWSITKVLKSDTGQVVMNAGAGVLAVAVAAGIISVVPPLRRWATTGSPMKRIGVLAGTSLAVGAIGLGLYAKQAGAKKALEAAPGVLISILVLSTAPIVLSSIVNRIDAWISKAANTTPATAGALPPAAAPAQGPVPEMRDRRQRAAIGADQIIAAQRRARVAGPAQQAIDAELW